MTTPVVPTFHPLKDSLAVTFQHVGDFPQFIHGHGGIDIGRRKFVIPKHRNTFSHGDMQFIESRLNEVQNATAEAGMYNPLCRMLTYLSINLAGTRSPAGQSLTLIRSSESFLHGLPEEARQKPDLLMLYAPKKRATEIINGTEAAFKGDRGLSAFSVIGCVEVKDDNKRADSQITRYLFSHSRHHPESFVRHGIVINKERFWFFSLGLEFHLVWDEVVSEETSTQKEHYNKCILSRLRAAQSSE